MWQSIYAVLTTYEGIYIFYLLPIVYFMTIVYNVISSRRREHHRIGIRDLTVVAAILLISLDFIHYLYLFLTHTGKLLPSHYLLPKYAVGCLLWLWIFWYSYEKYFARHVAGEQFKARYINLLWVSGGSLVLACVGVMLS